MRDIPPKDYRKEDWLGIAFFAGLFVVMCLVMAAKGMGKI